MTRLQTKVADFDYSKYDRSLTEELIHQLDNKGMINEILRKVSAQEDTDDTMGDWVLLWAQRVMPKKCKRKH